MRCVVLYAALATALTPSRAGAQTLSLTEADVLARLSAGSPRVRAIRAGIDIARADVLSAGRWPNPRFIEDRESVVGVIEYLTMVAQPLPITGRRGLEVQAASALVEAASARSDDALRRARADLRLAYAQLVAAQSRERTLTTSRDRLRELAEILAKREAAGDAAGFDRLRAEREVSDMEADLGVAATERARAQAAIASFFAEAIDPARIVAAATVNQNGSSIGRPAPPGIDALVERAISARGDLRALQQEADAAVLAARAADRRRIPEPEIIAGTKSSNFEGGGGGSVVTVTVPLPLFDRGKPERALAEARARQARAQADVFRLTLRSELEALRAAVTERRQTAERYRSSGVAGADEIERVARVSYDAGERGILELLDAYRTGSTARVRQATLDLAARQAEVELEFASGWEMP
jgi:outer membrane protein, heavy metal efflux system